MDIDKLAVLALADTMLASDGSMVALVGACQRVFAAPQAWAPRVCAALIEHAGENFHYFSRHELADILWQLLGRAACDADTDTDTDTDGDADDLAALAAPPIIALPPVRHYCIDPPLRPAAPAWLAALALPQLATVGDLAAWLGEPVGALDWFADQWRLGGKAQTPLQHYHYRWVPKRSGGWRLIEIPKQRLRRLQQKILHQLLDLVPPHPAAHGFRRGHSCLTHAALHAGQPAVIRMDLKDFFPSVQAARIHALFEKLGYPPNVAGTLARLCVNRAPHGVLRDRQGDTALLWSERQALTTPHLPQGAPSSPALANLCAYRLDMRLAALAQTLGASYSRYADDLAFSGGEDFARAAARFHIQVAAIALEEGFRVNTRKTRLMRAGARQQVTGVVVNAHPNLARDEYDRLKAVLTNCVRHGPASQNRAGHADFRAHLAGKISHTRMLNALRAGRLQALFEAIAWDLH
ncbi:reverse transcriptase family protein [Massilia sp. SR12]